MIVLPTNVQVNFLKNKFLIDHQVELYLQREDLIHPEISGNKWRKLLFNIQAFQSGDYEQIITFGGAFSNHIAATAAVGKIYHIKTIGIIRGESSSQSNPTLSAAQQNGMELIFVSRESYRDKQNETLYLHKKFPKSYIIPEGGSNMKGVLGCIEIPKIFQDFDCVFSACGTGTTLSGIIHGLKNNQKAYGIPVLKGAEFLKNDIQTHLTHLKSKNNNWELLLDYHFGGYAKFNNELIDFIRWFYSEFKIQLDPIYTGKMLFAVFDQIKKGNLKNQKILAIHTGGIQGIKGFEERFKLKIF